ncbi:PLDc N-terminal domain-containing protein [Agromyces endophyticus]|uniref:PLDc N-terminal domain-containing protein n=1 Tax=Agromyces sp. H17E-10 TaxID=2932244 RepID=UPI001FD62C27|nr:PLDc N-terminal domain-containing protein [Agromyces sp. H17E-10]UOQ90613.1 PLDc N-terminal domain-containing protein [Agromyces sp. H17E-10]
MARLLFGLVVAVAIFMIYAVVDCAMIDRSRIRGIARGWWIIVILIIPVIGGLLWFIVGRARAERLPGGRRRTVAPDDDADFLRRLGDDQAQSERIRRLEAELADLDGEADASDGGHGAGRKAEPGKRPDNPETPGDPGSTGRPNA